MFVFTLKNFFIFNFIYSVLNFNKSYIRNFLIPSNSIILFKENFFLNFKKLIFYKILKRKKIFNFIIYFDFKIYILNSKLFFNFNFFNFFKKKFIFFENSFIIKVKFCLKNYIFYFFLNNCFFKVFIFFI